MTTLGRRASVAHQLKEIEMNNLLNTFIAGVVVVTGAAAYLTSNTHIRQCVRGTFANDGNPTAICEMSMRAYGKLYGFDAAKPILKDEAMTFLREKVQQEIPGIFTESSE